MLKWILIPFIFLLTSLRLNADTVLIDSLRRLVKQPNTKEEQVKLKLKLASALYYTSPEQALALVKESLESAKELNHQGLISNCYNVFGVILANSGEYDEGIKNIIDALKIREKIKDFAAVSHSYNNLSGILLSIGENEKALDYIKKAIEFKKLYLNDSTHLADSYLGLGIVYEKIGFIDSAKNAYAISIGLYGNDNGPFALHPAINLAEIMEQEGKAKEALAMLQDAMSKFKGDLNDPILANKDLALAKIYSSLNKEDLARGYLRQCYMTVLGVNDLPFLSEITKAKSEFHKKLGEFDSAFIALEEHMEIERNAASEKTKKRIAVLEFQYENDKKQKALALQEKEIRYQYALLAFVIPISVISLVLAIAWYISFKQKKKAFEDMNSAHHQVLEASRIIQGMKDSLEDQVKERTQKILDQNKKLIDYAYLNSHKLRGPLARMMGLATLIMKETDPAEKQKLLQHLYEVSHEMDNIVRTINQIVSADTPDVKVDAKDK
jgi:tetratricopeptide (TPR) repeat protein